MVTANFEKFTAEYERQLIKAVSRFPGEYGYPVSAVPVVVGKMSASFAHKSYNKDGRAIKNTCKALGIPYTYTGINAFLGT